MVEQADTQLREWVSRVAKDEDVTFTIPPPTATTSNVALYLLDLLDAPRPKTDRAAPLQIYARYLVTTWAAVPEDAHRVLGNLIFAAMDAPGYEVDLSPLSPTLWIALGTPPRPYFLLRVPVRKERIEPIAKPVTKPLRVDAAVVTTLFGVVLGPEDFPIANARIEYPALAISTQSDMRGKFQFRMVPAQVRKELRVQAKRKSLNVVVDEDYPDITQPLIIRINPLEE